MAVGVVIILALIITAGIVRYASNEEYTKRESDAGAEKSRQLKVRQEAAIELAKLHKSCGMCGAKYEPELDA